VTGQQTTVMWLGVALILTRLFTTKQWSQIWTSVSPAPAAATPQNHGGIGGCPKGQIKVNGMCLNLMA
jgi:hypothetical protein